MNGRRVLDELGFYALAGQPQSSREIVAEMQEAEELGLGAALISERYNLKEAATLCGAAAAVTGQIRIATAATNHNTRHPMVTAGFARTMQSLSNGRFTLGLGRGIPLLFGMHGIDPITTRRIEEFAGLMRRLFKGEYVLGHSDGTRTYPVLHLDSDLDEHLPLLLVAFGPRSLELGGRCFDDVVLHTYFTDETTSRAVRTVKESAERAGRDPAGVRVWSCFATIGDHLSEELRLRKSVGRLATYLQGYGDLMVETNGWDPDVLTRFRSDPVVAGFRSGIDAKASIPQLEHIAGLIPEEWLAPSATGSPEDCVNAVLGQFDLGCDAVILHGATPSELAPIVAAYRGRT
ncbi:MAG: TIGR03857 family LLM class F420-dependent oxidoreductase [Actinobacteria bacterium ATB1]|nr:TIGR03857 family LLM class F420-dependent oxidoreductase [Actinobacteria bacterium ATB1]